MLEKNKGEVLSGESIAGELGCTRAAVWKAVKSLREEGYHIEAGPNKGYMLAKDTNRLSQEGITRKLIHCMVHWVLTMMDGYSWMQLSVMTGLQL